MDTSRPCKLAALPGQWDLYPPPGLNVRQRPDGTWSPGSNMEGEGSDCVKETQSRAASCSHSRGLGSLEKGWLSCSSGDEISSEDGNQTGV